MRMDVCAMLPVYVPHYCATPCCCRCCPMYVPCLSWWWEGEGEGQGHEASAGVALCGALAVRNLTHTLALSGRTMPFLDPGIHSLNPVAELAERCYEAARGAEPALVAVWEGMAAAAAMQGCPMDAAAMAEHAVGLGGGPESWLDVATGAGVIFLPIQPCC